MADNVTIEPGPAAAAAEAAWEEKKWMPCRLSLDLRVPGFTVGDLLRLQPGSVVDCHWPHGNDMPLRVNGQLIAWTEFEVVDGGLAVRITELA